MLKKYIISFFLFAISTLILYGQDSMSHHLLLGISYDYSILKKGYVQVREDAYSGTILPFGEDNLDLDVCMSIAIRAEYEFHNENSLFLNASRTFFINDAAFTGSIWYNGTHINASNGLSIKQSQLYHVSAGYIIGLCESSSIVPKLLLGLVYDGLIFNVEGESLPDSYRYEQREKFIRQSIPYPSLGIELNSSLSRTSSLCWKLEGTYIPTYTSFFNEGGSVDLQYTSADMNLGYNYTYNKLKIGAEIFYKILELHEQSAEDTNDFSLHHSGIELSASFQL
jgi:hypothetical protein